MLIFCLRVSCVVVVEGSLRENHNWRFGRCSSLLDHVFKVFPQLKAMRSLPRLAMAWFGAAFREGLKGAFPVPDCWGYQLCLCVFVWFC